VEIVNSDNPAKVPASAIRSGEPFLLEEQFCCLMLQKTPDRLSGISIHSGDTLPYCHLATGQLGGISPYTKVQRLAAKVVVDNQR
jgi:hypothetical protein